MTWLREATIEDHKKIMDIAKLSPCTRDFGSIMFSSESSYKKGWIVVSEGQDGDEIVMTGFYCVRHKVREPVTSLYFIGVQPWAQGHGDAMALMAHLVERSRPTIRLNCMKTNKRALRFYEKIGFKRVGDGLGGEADMLELETARAKLNI